MSEEELKILNLEKRILQLEIKILENKMEATELFHYLTKASFVSHKMIQKVNNIIENSEIEN